MSEQSSDSELLSERRQAKRVKAHKTIVVSLAGESVRIVNMSTSGVAIHGVLLKIGSQIRLELNLGKRHLSTSVEILRHSASGASYGKFIALEDEDKHYLHDYLYEVSH